MKSFGEFILLTILCVAFMTNTSVGMVKVTKTPGKCYFRSIGKKTIISDNNGNDVLLVCLRNNGKFTWKALSNFPTLGEYFDPADDCSQIAQKKSNAKDGFYWIKRVGLDKPTKVWCDVTTDGGGFMLVGHKDSPVSWTLPSHPSVVAPDGEPHWSSVLGNASMLEFRIQISITKIQKQSKADWIFRFKSARQLKELFIDKQGCTYQYPGIGNIQYIKDLLTEKVVTQRFRCSRFGPSYPSNLGWKLLNKCFGQECRKGYGIISGFLQYDHFGSFSYSTNLQMSGIVNNSTAFIGCDHGKCCACFGRKGATGDFCSPRCGSINGGTVTMKAHTWFWIRSSVPKRPFLKKCMEYIVKTEKGNEETHFIDTKSGVLKKGSCTTDGVANLVDGVVQVDNKAALNKVPLVKGLMSYRKDNEKLYLTNGQSWQALGKENQIEDLVNRVKKNLSQLAAANAELQKEVKVLEIKYRKHFPVKESKTRGNNCADLYKKGIRKTGVYTIDPDGLGSFNVRCDMTKNGGGWTIFQRRMDGSVDFYLGWDDYKKGFGKLHGEFWLGLDKIHRLSKSGQNVLRVDLEDFENEKRYVQYNTFAVANETDKYKLTIGGYSGDAGDSLKGEHNGMMFTTKDVDNDKSSRYGNCAVTFKGAWWYKDCHESNLNGRYLRGAQTSYADGINWYTWRGYKYSLKKTEMKIRPPLF